MIWGGFMLSGRFECLGAGASYLHRDLEPGYRAGKRCKPAVNRPLRGAINQSGSANPKFWAAYPLSQ